MESEWLQFLKQRKEDKEHDEMEAYFGKLAEEIEMPTMDPLSWIEMRLKCVQEAVGALAECIHHVKEASKNPNYKISFPVVKY